MIRLKIYFSLFLMSFAAIGFAASEDPRPGLSAGARVCATLYPAADQMECTLNMASGYVFDASVARMCGDMSRSDDKFYCVRVAAGKTYTIAEIRACSQDANPSTVIHCLAGAGAQVAAYAFAVDFTSEKRYAGQFCGGIDSDGLRWQCLTAVVRGYTHTPEAVNLCATFATERDQVTCLQTIAGKVISAGEVEVCANQYPTAKKYQCLSQINRRYPW